MQLKVNYSSIKKFFEIIIIYFCLFPYVSFGLNRMDSQPWALILVSVYILFNLKFEKRNIFILWLVSIFVIICSILYVQNDVHLREFIRAVSNYSIVFFIWLFSIIINRKYNPVKHYIISSWIYISYAIIQLSGLRFLDWMSPNRTSLDRGVTSFAAEPTFFAIILFFISWLIFNGISKINCNNTNKFSTYRIGFSTIVINLFMIIFVAKSATVILLLLVVGISTFILFISKKTLYFLSVFVLSASLFLYLNLKPNFLFKDGLEQTRPIKIAKLMSELDLQTLHRIIYNDESINGRVAQVAIPYIGIIKNYGVPGGYFTFEKISNKIVQPDNFFYSRFGRTHKIQSFIGVFVYELGALGVILLSFMAFSLKREFNWKWREIFILFISLIPSVPLGMGLVPLLFGSKIISKHSN